MNKKQKKEASQKSWGLLVNGQIPMVVVTHVDPHIQVILDEIVDGIAAVGIQLVVVEPEDAQGRERCQKWHEKHPEAISVISKDEADSDIFDMALLEDLTVEELKKLRKQERVPVAEKGMIEPFDPIREEGNGFSFNASNPWTLLVALVRAAETYRFPYDWKNLVKSLGKTEELNAH